MTFRFIDTHCHFDFPPFVGNEECSLNLARQEGVSALIVPSISANHFDDVIRLSQQYSGVYAALGLHPVYIALHTEQSVEQLKNYLTQSPAKLIALGEIGLDDYIQQAQMERQIVLLEQQLKLAKRYDLPVILHSRRTHDLLAKKLKQATLPRTGVVHGFSGSQEQAKAFVKLGYSIGVGGVITYERAQKTRKAIAALPLSTLVLETDAPDMPVAGFQGRSNRPERLCNILTALSEIRTEPVEQIAEQIYFNTCRLFNIPI